MVNGSGGVDPSSVVPEDGHLMEKDIPMMPGLGLPVQRGSIMAKCRSEMSKSVVRNGETPK